LFPKTAPFTTRTFPSLKNSARLTDGQPRFYLLSFSALEKAKKAFERRFFASFFQKRREIPAPI
jgi:hypothetical protein